MAQCTDPRLRRSVIYELYVRSHTPQGRAPPATSAAAPPVPAAPERPAGGACPLHRPPFGGGLPADPGAARPGGAGAAAGEACGRPPTAAGAAPVVLPPLRALPGRTKTPLHPPAKWVIIKPKNPHRE